MVEPDQGTRVAPWATTATQQLDRQPLSQALQGRFRIERELGTGGMGRVLLAFDPALDRPVAIKIILQEILLDPHWLERFKLEATVAAGLQHPGIVQVYEIFEAAGTPMLVMEYVEGVTLKQAIEERHLSDEDVASIMAKVCEAVVFAHARGVIHRDIKPGNIMLTSDGVPKVTDFGLATQRNRSTSASIDAAEQGSVLGSPAYMAPEQVCGDLRSIDNRTDVYSLGATLYYLLTGRPPVRGGNTTELLTKVLEHDIARPSPVRRGVNRDLEAICLKALQKQPSRRYSGADEMAQDLRSSVAGRPVMARRYPPWEFLRRAISYRKEAFLTGLATVLLMQLRIQWSVLSLHATASAELFGGLRRQVTDLASLASQMIDPRHVAAAMARGATQGAEVEGLEAALDKVVQRSPDLRSVWIVRSTSPDGKTMQILAQSVPSEADAAAIPSSGGSPAGSGQPFDASLHPELLEGLQGPTADKSYRIARDPKASDQRGVGLSGYAPVLDQSGRSIAVLGVDVSKADLDNRFAELDRKLIAPLVLSAVLSLVATALIVAALAALWGRRK